MDDRRYQRWLWVMLGLLLVSCAAFALTTYWLSRMGSPLAMAEADSQATQLVEKHFAALERGDLRTAYGQFSARYRHQLSFDAFSEVMANHWRFLEGRIRMFPHADTSKRVMVVIHFNGDDGSKANAEFTLIRNANRWWIDDVRWGRERAGDLIYV